MGHKYVGLDVHQSSTVAVVQDEKGKSVMESVLATEAEAIRDFLKGLRGTIHVTFEEGTQAVWLYEIVKPVVAEVIVCNPRRNKLLAVGNKADRVDAQKLAELLRCGSTAAEGAGAQLRFAGERYDAGNESGEGDLSGPSDQLRGPGCVLPAEPGAVAGEVDRAGSASACQVALPATGHAEGAETRSEQGDAESITAASGLPDLERDSGI